MVTRWAYILLRVLPVALVLDLWCKLRCPHRARWDWGFVVLGLFYFLAPFFDVLPAFLWFFSAVFLYWGIYAPCNRYQRQRLQKADGLIKSIEEKIDGLHEHLKADFAGLKEVAEKAEAEYCAKVAELERLRALVKCREGVRVPVRPADFRRWFSVWQMVHPLADKGWTTRSIHKWLIGQKKTSIDYETLNDIVKAGRDGLLDRDLS